MPRSESLTSDSKKGSASHESKDLTQILDYGKKLEEQGLFPRLGEGNDRDTFAEEARPEKIEHFESIDEIGLMDHAPADPKIAAPNQAPIETAQFESPSFDISPPQDPGSDLGFQIPAEPSIESGTGPGISSPEPVDFGFTETPRESSAPPLDSESLPEFDPLPTEEVSPPFDTSFQQPAEQIETTEQAFQSELPEVAPHPPTESISLSTSVNQPAMDATMEVDSNSPVQVAVTYRTAPETASTRTPHPVSTPPRIETHESGYRLFTLQIVGFLKPDEQARLSDLLERSDLGLRPNDISVQLASGRVRIPRISEYLGVLIVQALRTSSSEIQIFEHPHEENTSVAPSLEVRSSTQEASVESTSLPPIRNVDSEGLAKALSLGPVTATSILPIESEAAYLQGPSGSEGYSRALDRMQLEMRRKAHSLHATFVSDFLLTWEALSPREVHALFAQRPELYHRGAWKLTATGLARRETR